MIKKAGVFLISAFATAVVSCKQGPDYKTIRDEVVSIHDSVMINTEKAYLNKRKLDTLVTRLDSIKKGRPALDTITEKQTMNKLRSQLEDADDQMSDWMHKFNADVSGKNEDEAVAYFNKEKAKIKAIDSVYVNLLKESDQYLLQFRKK
ncbi:hypothetical protein [Desertivirga brevis]|uniref:hypothetical protein n=1 Tax=Desertivirga brevis TaxID=2810310 RepID=UPI001A978118|nr:hypothetical protein [Pedobacter sp. SYSU D00873]